MNDRRDHDRYDELLAGYVLGALDESDRSEFMTHLDGGCPTCRELHPELFDVATLLLIAAQPATPPPALRGKILAAAGVDTTRTTSASGEPVVVRIVPRLARERILTGLALAAALALAILGPSALTWRDELIRTRKESADRSSELARLTAELDGLKATTTQQAALLDLIGRPESGLVTLASLAPAPGASGKVLWDKEQRKGYLWVRHLPVDPEGKDYQLWAIQGSAPVSAGVFSVTADGSALIPLSGVGPDAPVAAFAVTLEPTGGLPAPSGPMVLLGNTGG
jgi:anti-sigma-K factor RskA